MIDDGDQAKSSFDWLRSHDQSQLRSSEIKRAFASVIRAASQGPQSEVSKPDEVSLEPDEAISDAQIVRGVD